MSKMPTSRIIGNSRVDLVNSVIENCTVRGNYINYTLIGCVSCVSYVLFGCLKECLEVKLNETDNLLSSRLYGR